MPPSSAPRCLLQILGQARLVRPDGQAHVLARLDAALLAALALQGPLPRERAMAWLWPQSERKAAQNSLRQRLFRLKDFAGCEVVTSAAVLQLGAAISHDLAAFDEQPASASQTDAELLGTLEYAGTGALADWVDQARRQWRKHRRERWARDAETFEREGDLPAALARTEQLLRDDRGAESAHRRRMRLLYLQGERAAALVAWADCQSALRDHADAEPGVETRELAGLILRSGLLPLFTPAATEPPAALLRPPRLIGREAAWQQLHEAWRQRQHVLVLGEPGIGKSRLLLEFARSQGLPVAPRARQRDEHQPYASLQRLLRALAPEWPAPVAWARAELARVLPEFGPPAAGPLEALRVQRALAQALADWHALGLRALLVDDVQLADGATLELLLACLPHPEPGMPGLWLASRAADVPAAVAAWRAAQPANAFVELSLAPLNRAQIGELVDSLGLPNCRAEDWAAPLAQRTGGNPLFILQVLKAAQGGAAGALQALPADVGRLIEERVSKLSAPALRLARVAALAGANFSLPLAAQVLGVHAIDLADGLGELERGQLMTGEAFAYDLVAEAVLRGVPQAVAQLLHAGIAGALQDGAAAPAAVAPHWLQAGDWAAAAAQFERAAEQAQQRARRADVVAWEDQAAACHRRNHDQPKAFAAALRAAEAALAAEDNARLALRVAALLDEAVGDAQRLHALLTQAHQLMAGGDARGAATEEALSLARQQGDPQLVMRASGVHAVALALGGQAGAALRLFEALLPAAGLGGAGTGTPVEQNFLSHYAYVLALAGRYRDSIEPIRRSAAIAEQQGDLASAMTEWGNLSTMLGSLGERDGSLQAGERALGIWRRQGEPPGVPAAAVHMNLGMYYLGDGRFAEALAAFEWALQQFRLGAAQAWASATEHHLVRLWIVLGQPARALRVLSPLPADAPPQVKVKRLVVQARIQRQLGRPAAALLRQAQDNVGALRLEDRLDLQLMRAAVLPPDEALVVCDEVLREARDKHPPATQAALARRADALRLLGRYGEAAEAARTALAGHAHSGSMEMARTQFCWLLWQAFDAAGNHAEADTVLANARAWLDAALPCVPPEFAESFTQRNPDHRGLLAQRARAAALT